MVLFTLYFIFNVKDSGVAVEAVSDGTPSKAISISWVSFNRVISNGAKTLLPLL